MKFAWHKNPSELIANLEIEEVDLDTYNEMLTSDLWEDEFEKGEDEIILDD